MSVSSLEALCAELNENCGRRDWPGWPGPWTGLRLIKGDRQDTDADCYGLCELCERTIALNSHIIEAARRDFDVKTYDFAVGLFDNILKQTEAIEELQGQVRNLGNQVQACCLQMRDLVDQVQACRSLLLQKIAADQ